MDIKLEDAISAKEIDELNKRCEDFLLREQRNLATFTRDPRLIYIADKQSETFHLDAKKHVVTMPLTPFFGDDYDDNLILWQLYRQIAMYSDWAENPLEYLNRNAMFIQVEDKMVLYILEKVKDRQLLDDEAYKPKVLKAYARRVISGFLDEMDDLYGALRVEVLCPIYRDQDMKDKIKNCNMEEIFQVASKSKRGKNEFANMFLRELIQGEKEIELSCKNNNETAVFARFSKPIFGKELFKVYKEEMKRCIRENQPVFERDKITSSLVLPEFVALWKEEIDEMDLMPSKGKNCEEGFGSPFEQDKAEAAKSLDISKEEKEKAIRHLAEEKEKIQAEVEDVIHGTLKLAEFGVGADAEKTYLRYSLIMDKQRKEMAGFWKKLIGEGKKEISVKNDNQLKGKLNVNSLINNYPNFVEAERRGSYKDVAIFDRYLLEPCHGMLPENIDVSFVVDNSGSMNNKKVDWARKALIVAMESLLDFGDYLQENANLLNQNVNLNLEVWFFGSNYKKQLSFEDKKTQGECRLTRFFQL